MKKTLVTALAALGLSTLSGAAFAVQTPDHLRGRPTLESFDGAPLRNQRELVWHQTPPTAARAWSELIANAGPGWQAGWDSQLRTPVRIWGPGIATPGVMSSNVAAEKASRALLAQYVGLLAPGAQASDFVMVSNDNDGHLRTVGFVQTYRGLPVVGGQVSFRFEHDRMVMMGSEARPHIGIESVNAAIGVEDARAAAQKWLETEASEVHQSSVDGLVVLPLIGNHVQYRLAYQMTIETHAPIGKWRVWVDARTGVPLAKEQLLHFATGNVLYHTPVRWPGGAHQDAPAADASTDVDGVAQLTDAAGAVTFANPTAQIATHVTGNLANVIPSQGNLASAQTTLADGGQFIWDTTNVEFDASQTNAFISLHHIKAYAKNIAPKMAWLDGQIACTVNIMDICNAYSDGDAVNFFASGMGCENTGRLPDVVYHEFGHSFHNHAIIPGVGVFESALSEGQADFMSATYNNDSAMGLGFFFDSSPLRELDPPNKEYRWPDDIDQDPHATGQIIGGALWDLRKLLITKYGQDAGVAKTNELYYLAVARASDIPTMYPEIVAADDDDGNLANGTPDICEINSAFGLHGLRAISAKGSDLGATPPTMDGYHVAIDITGLYPQCAEDKAMGATVRHRLRKDVNNGMAVAMTPTMTGFEATIPVYPSGQVVNYQVEVDFASGQALSYPDNAADPWYEFFVGNVTKIYCTDFEKDPNKEGWTHDVDMGGMGQGADDWQWGDPAGAAGSGDPGAAYSGKNVFGNDLGHGMFNGEYQPNVKNHSLSPMIDTTGHNVVRLQYRRWLNVEDGHFDHARIYANGVKKWENFDSNSGDMSHTQHADKEWRFQDVDLTTEAQSGAVQIKYEIESDPGLELGGWTLDDFCVVAYDTPFCGDGKVDPGEECDTGKDLSDTTPNACRASCAKARCGDGVLDDGEACDDANMDDTDTCHNDCTVNTQPGKPKPGTTQGGAVTIGGCGCEVANSNNSGALPWLAALAALALARKKSRARK
jgi:cysteine-rich repeat protein